MPRMPAAVARLEDVPEAIRSFYRQTGDRYVLDVEPAQGFGLDDVASLKKQLSQTAEEKRRATELLRSYEEDGELLPADELKRLRAEQRKAAERKARTGQSDEDVVQAQIDAVKQQEAKRYASEAKKLQDRIDQLNASVRRQVVTNAAMQALAKEGANADLLMPHVERSLRVEEADGQFVARVIDDDGKSVRLSQRQGNSDPMDVGEFVGTLRARYPQAFAATQRTGSGTEATAVGNRGAHPVRLSVEEARNPQRYRQARAEAEKLGVQIEIPEG